MSRIILTTAAGWLVVATIHVAAQQPRSGTGAVPRSITARATPARVVPPKILPGTRPDVFSLIQGNALTATDEALANVAIRLRDARVGQIVETQVTDSSGLFAFPTVDPGSYIVEVLGADRSTVLAASQVLNVSAGEAVSAVVKLPFGAPFLRIIGSEPPSFEKLSTQAAASGVAGTESTGTETCVTLRP